MSNHFNNGHCNLDHLQVVPLEKLQRIENFRPKGKENYIGPLTREEAITLSVDYSMTNNHHLLDREHHWITRLKTLTPNGLNLRTEVSSPIPLRITFSDSACIIAKMVKEVHLDLKSYHHGFRRNTMVTAFKRNKNLKDYLVSASLR